MNDLKFIAEGLMKFIMKNASPTQQKSATASEIIIISPEKKELVLFL